MKYSPKLLPYALVAIGALGSCGTDDFDDPLTPPAASNRVPVISLEEGGVLASPLRLVPDSLIGRSIEYTLSGTDPDGNMVAISVNAGGAGVATGADLVEIDGEVVVLGDESVRLTGNDKSAFAKTVRVRAPQDFEDSTVYSLIVVDTFGLADTVGLTLVTGDRPTPLFNDGEAFVGVRFYNQRTPASFRGAVDLDTGEPVATSADDRSELQDARTPLATPWLRQLQAESGADIFVVPAARANRASFDDVESLEDLLELYDAARPDNEPGGSITPELSAGDLIVVTKPVGNGGTRFYLVFFDNVNDGAAEDNTDDYYEISIKRSAD